MLKLPAFQLPVSGRNLIYSHRHIYTAYSCFIFKKHPKNELKLRKQEKLMCLGLRGVFPPVLLLTRLPGDSQSDMDALHMQWVWWLQGTPHIHTTHTLSLSAFPRCTRVSRLCCSDSTRTIHYTARPGFPYVLQPGCSYCYCPTLAGGHQQTLGKCPKTIYFVWTSFWMEKTHLFRRMDDYSKFEGHNKTCLGCNK